MAPTCRYVKSGTMVLLCSCLTAVSMTAQAKRDGRWQRIDNALSPSIWVDTKTVQTIHGDQQYRVWLKLLFASPQKDPDDKLYAWALDREEIDCKDRKSKSVQVIRYDSLGAVVSSYTFQNPQWEEPIPASIGEAMIDGLCTAVKFPWIPESP